MPRTRPATPPDHGTVQRYRAPYRCRCDDCRQANTEYGRTLRGGKPMRAAQHGTRSKYRAGCRCGACRTANRMYQREVMRDRQASGLVEKLPALRSAPGTPEPERPIRMRAGMTVPEHGTVQRYRSPWRCRCDDCRQANTVHQRKVRGSKRMQTAQHGTLAKYTKGCRCAACKMAGSKRDRSGELPALRGQLLSIPDEWITEGRYL